MQLPIIPKKQFTHFNKFLNKKFTLVPFTQGQQSILLEVNSEIEEKDELTSEDIRLLVREKLEAIKQVISECVIKDSIDELPYFVIEELFLALRSKSIGEIIDLNYICKNQLEDESVCNNKLKLSIDVSKISAEVDKEFNNEIVIYDEDGVKIGVVMKFMTLDDMIDSTYLEGSQLPFITMLDSIFDNEAVYKKKDYLEEDLKNFFDSISPEGLLNLKEKFFDRLPTIKYEDKITCDKCGKEHSINLKGLNDFFG